MRLNVNNSAIKDYIMDHEKNNRVRSRDGKMKIPLLFIVSTDFLIFIDAANNWGVDYDSSIDDSNSIRSSIGIGVDWFTVVGPLNFSIAQSLTKDSNDKLESFRFNLGTTF